MIFNYPRIDENPIYNDNRIDQEDNTIGEFSGCKDICTLKFIWGN